MAACVGVGSTSDVGANVAVGGLSSSLSSTHAVSIATPSEAAPPIVSVRRENRNWLPGSGTKNGLHRLVVLRCIDAKYARIEGIAPMRNGAALLLKEDTGWHGLLSAVFHTKRTHLP